MKFKLILLAGLGVILLLLWLAFGQDSTPQPAGDAGIRIGVVIHIQGDRHNA